MANKDYAVNIMVDQVKSVNISRYADGYNYASISSKVADNEYMSIHYEWKGKQIPEFALQAMDIMKAIGTEKANTEVEEDSVAYLERAAKIITALAAKMKKKDMEDEEDMEEEDKDGKKKAKKKKDC